MNIYTATADFLPQVKTIFPEAEIYSEDKHGDNIDLMIFTGGEDINPRLYLQEDDIDADNIHYNDDRDKREIDVWNKVFKYEVPKVLGICRGLQFINVMLRGTLTLDILTKYGKSHKNVHELLHTDNSKFKKLGVVNSLHHQCIEVLGDVFSFGEMPFYYSPTVMAIEKSTGTIEIVEWIPEEYEDRIAPTLLGVQFHPEFFMDELPEKAYFKKIINNWLQEER